MILHDQSRSHRPFPRDSFGLELASRTTAWAEVVSVARSIQAPHETCSSTTSPSCSSWSRLTALTIENARTPDPGGLQRMLEILWISLARSSTVLPMGSVKGLVRSAGLPGTLV